MEFFSEIYSSYYRAVSEILKHKKISLKNAVQIIKEKAFIESDFFIIPKLKSDDVWRFAEFKNNEFISKLENLPFMPITVLEKRWIKSVLNDEKALLFLDKSEIESINSRLGDIEPLYDNRYYHFFDIFLDGDNFADEKYIENFRILLKAIKERRILHIDYISGKDNRLFGNFMPFSIEFSAKNNKFRVYTIFIRKKRSCKICIMNISRIAKIIPTDRIYPFETDMKKIIKSCQCTESVEIIIYPQRNAVERFMMEFADCQKTTEFDKKTGICRVWLWFDRKDETEILIKLLSFGPVIKIKESCRLNELCRRRVIRQNNLMKKYNQSEK